MGTGKNCGSKLKTRKSIIMKSKGKSSYYTYAGLGICIAFLPLLVAAAQYEEDLIAEESQNIGILQPRAFPAQPVAVQTVAVPAVVPPPASSQASFSPAATPFTIPKGDLAGAPSYSSRFAVSSVNPYWDRFPSEVASFRRRAQAEDDTPEDDYQPSESKGKKSAPSVFKRVSNGIRNTGKAIIGAPSYIYKRYRKYWGGGKKKKGGWKSYSSSSDKNDGWGGWEEVEPSKGYDYESSHYPSEKGWRSSSKGNNNNGYSSYDSHERRNDRDRGSSNYRDYNRDKDDYRDYDNREYSTKDRHERSRPRDRQSKYNNNSYREETHYDDYDGRRTTAYYNPSRKSHPTSSSRRPSNGSSSSSGSKGNYRYDDYN